MQSVWKRVRVGSGIVLGVGLLAALWGISFLLGVLWPGPLVHGCPLGADLLRPDRTVCELAIGGLWISLTLGLAAGALATFFGLAVATAARSASGIWDRSLMAAADAFFSLPDILILMVIQFAIQTVGDLKPALRMGALASMIFSLALVGWAAPARMFRNRLRTLEGQDYVTAAQALGAGPWQLLRIHLLPGLRAYGLAIFLTRVPAAIAAESTVSFLGIGKVEPMSLGRYLGESYPALMYASGARIVVPAWILLMLIVLGAAMASRGLSVWAERVLSPSGRGSG